MYVCGLWADSHSECYSIPRRHEMYMSKYAILYINTVIVMCLIGNIFFFTVLKTLQKKLLSLSIYNVKQQQLEST